MGLKELLISDFRSFVPLARIFADTAVALTYWSEDLGIITNA